MIEVNKRLTIAASAGSAATVLDAGGAPITVVKITADDVTFGGPTRGFTLTGAGASAGVGSTHHGLTMSAVDGKVQGCQALGNAGRGFEVGGERHTLASNLAVGNGEFGFAVDCSDCTVSRNVATGNGYAGFAVFRSASRVVDNVAIGNDLYGIQVGGGGHVVMHNSAIANRRAGLYMTGSVDVRVTANNIFGNGLDEGFWHNCGLVKAASGDLEAEGNYFGAATGPGLDPADAVCTQAPGTTDVTPFATKPFAVSPPTRR
jgi:parallel beta-helix repeat protein